MYLLANTFSINDSIKGHLKAYISNCRFNLEFKLNGSDYEFIKCYYINEFVYSSCFSVLNQICTEKVLQ